MLLVALSATVLADETLDCSQVTSMRSLGVPEAAITEAVVGTELAPCVGLEAPPPEPEPEPEPPVGQSEPGEVGPLPELDRRFQPRSLSRAADPGRCMGAVVAAPDPAVALAWSLTVAHGTGMFYAQRPIPGGALLVTQLALEGALVAGVMGPGSMEPNERLAAIGLASGALMLARKAEAVGATLTVVDERERRLRELGCLD
ncbi:MAG: hypothetical protein GY884_14285 [Proteobacteria bacterium]|nr:hypothetical protein [Pseudomonadota bacterium]